MNEELTRMVAPEVIKMNVLQRIIALFTAPGELMKNIKVYPVILVPFLLSLVIGLVGIAPTRQSTELANQELSHIFTERYPGAANPWDIASFADEYGEAAISEGYLDAVTLVTLILFAAIGPLLVSLLSSIGLFILCKIMRGSVTFVQMFSMCIHTYVLMALGSLVTAFFISLTGNIVDITSLAAVVSPNGRLDDVMHNAFSAVTVFIIWSVVLEFIGVKILNNFSAVKAGIVVAIGFAAYVAVTVAMVMSTWWALDIAMATRAM